METTITVDFPKSVYQRLQRQARMMRTPIAEIIVQMVQYRLPAWLEVIPPEHEKALAKLCDLSNAQLERIAKRKLSMPKQRKLDKLLEKNREDFLTFREREELDALRLEADFLTLKKAQALSSLRNEAANYHCLFESF